MEEMSDEQLAQNCARLQGQSLMLKTLLQDLQKEGHQTSWTF